MNDMIYRQDVIELAMQYCPDDDGTCSKADEDIRNLLDELEALPSAQPDNQINLCDSCNYSYPDCPSKNDDVIFGNGIGNDNICACNKYKPSARPEIIRCKDCYHYPGEYTDCPMIGWARNENDFCSKVERKDDD